MANKYVSELLNLAKKAGCSAQVYHAVNESIPISFENDKLKSLDSKFTEFIAIRVIKDGKIGFCYSTNLSNLQELLKRALASAKFGQLAKFEFTVPKTIPEVKIWDDEISKLDMSSVVKQGENAIGHIHEYNPLIRCDIGFDKSIKEITIANTAGFDSSYKSSGFSVGMGGVLAKEGDILSIYEWEGSKKLNDINFSSMIDQVIKKFKLCEKQVKIEPEKAIVVLGPKAFYNLFSPLSAGLNGKMVQKGASFLANFLGKQIFDEKLSIYDDGIYPYAPASVPIDDEGVPSERTALIEKGVMKQFIFDQQTAGIMGAKSTGNGFGVSPVPHFTNLVIAGGTTPYKDIIKNIKNGILIEQSLAGGGDTFSGGFQLNVDIGFKIENGELTGRVKNTMVSGRILENLKSIADISKETYKFSSFILPTLCFDNLKIAVK